MMKKLTAILILIAALLALGDRVHAVPIPCITCGSTALVGPGIDGTVSYAVITGQQFNTEVGLHAIGFFGAVPQGTLGPIINPVPTDFVYLYQLVNDGPNQDLIQSWSISGGIVGSASGLITAGTRLESTLLVDPGIGLVSAGPAGATTGLSGGPTVDFENGLGDPQPVPVPLWGPCLGSGPSGVQCSDSQADLLLASVLMSNWQETPSGIFLDPLWSGSIIWFASPKAPGNGLTSIVDVAGNSVNGFVPVPVPEPSTILLLGGGLLGFVAFRRKFRK